MIFNEFLQPSALVTMLPTPVANLDGLGLKIEWEIERTRSSSPDQGKITIYNLSAAARQAAYSTWAIATRGIGYIMELSIGWGPLVERVYVGDAWRMTPEVRVGEDVLTVWELGDGNKQVRDATVGASFAEATLDVLLRYLVNSVLQVPIDPVSEAKILERAAQLSIYAWNNYVMNGDPQDRLDDLMATLGLQWKIYQGQFVVLDRGNFATADPVAFQLSVASGLLEWATLDDGNIQVTALANPNIRPGHQVQVIDSFGVPVGAARHRVETISFAGATDAASVMKIIGRKAVLV